MSFSKPAVKRTVDDEHRQFQEKWETGYFFVEHRGNIRYLICTEKRNTIRHHYSTRYAEQYAKYQGDEREDQHANPKTCLLRQHIFFKNASKESDAAVEASYVVM